MQCLRCSIYKTVNVYCSCPKIYHGLVFLILYTWYYVSFSYLSEFNEPVSTIGCVVYQLQLQLCKGSLSSLSFAAWSGTQVLMVLCALRQG